MRDAPNPAEVNMRNELEVFSYAVSHDLRTPLRHIQSFTELLTEHLQESLDDQGRHYLHVIANAALEMDDLINNLIPLFKINDSIVNIEKVNLNILLAEVVDSFQSETSGRKIEWDIGKLPELYSDSNLLRTVMTNLISNALKFTRFQDTAHIRIAAETANPDFILLMIKDNGVGFEMKNKDKLFGVLQKMHNNKEFEGVGIGLAYVKRIVQKLGGTVSATGELNHGAAFFVSLPAMRND